MKNAFTDNSLFELHMNYLHLRSINHGIHQNLISYLKLFSMVSHSITFLLGVMGNGLVIWISTFKMKKTVNVIWFLNLAIADFIFDVLLPLHIVSMAMGDHWPFGNFMCKMACTVFHLNMLVSVSFLVLISIDRCLSVQFPVWSRNHRTPRLACKIALVTWLLAVIISSPYPALYETMPNFWDNIIYCIENNAIPWINVSNETFYLKKLDKIIVITRFITMFLIPFAFIISCYGTIALKIKNRQLSPSSRPFKLIIIILVLFFVCRFPYYVIPVLERYEIFLSWDYRFRYITTYLATCLAYFNSCLNPILYVFIGRDFKETFRRSILSVFERAFKEELAVATLDEKHMLKESNQVVSQML